MATDIDELQIHIQSEAAGASKSLNNLIKKLDKLSVSLQSVDASKLNAVMGGFNGIGTASRVAAKGTDKASESAKKAVQDFNKLTISLGKYYATFALLTKGAKSVWKGIESSMDYVETSNYFSVALGEIGKQFESAGYESAELYTEALSSELNKLNEKLTGYSVGSKGEALFSGSVGLGMDIEQMMNFQAKTLAVTNSVGLMGEASIETAKAVSMLAGDISSLTNTDLETVMTNLSSGLIGQSRALYKYGIDITQNTLQQYALAEGIDKAVSEMTQSEKMQLRLLAILDQSDVSTADLANTVNSVANQYRIFGQQIDNTGRTLGNLFLPIVKNVLPWVNGLIIAINNLLTSLGFQIYGDTWLEDLQDGISGGVQEDFEDFEGSVDGATDSVEKFKKSVRGFDELNVLTGGTSVGSGVLGELEGQIDLTDRIADAVADYESAWDEAFANAENKASEFAKEITESFGEAVDVFEELFPLLTGLGSAFVTYKIASKVSDLSTALIKSGGAIGVLTGGLKAIASPAGVVTLAAGALGALAGALHQMHEEAKKTDAEQRFGNISLSLEDIDRVAREILDNKNLSKVSTLLSGIGELSGIESQIQSSVSALDKLNWKVSIGMELTEEEQGEYKSAIDTYVKNANAYVEQMQYSANVGIELFLSDSETSSSIQSVVNSFYSQQSGKLAELGKKLNEVTTNSWNDGLLAIDEVEAITNIQKQMADIQSQISNSQFQAKMQLLEADFSGSELTLDAYKELVEKRNEILEEYESDFNESLVFTLGQINIAYETKIKGAKLPADKKQLEEEWDKAIKETIQGRDAKVAEMTLNALSFDYNTLVGTYGEELDKVIPQIVSLLDEAAADISFLSSTATNENAINGYLKQLKKDIDSVLKELPKETRDNLKAFLAVFESAEDFEKIAQSYYENTGKVPQAIIDALSSMYTLKAISGSKEDMLNALLVDANTVEAKQITTAMVTLGIDTIDAYANGIKLQTSIGEKAVTDYLTGISGILKQSKLLDVAEEAGEEVANAFTNGLTGFQLKELMPSSGNYVPIDTSRFPSSWESNLPKINITTQSFPSAPLSDSALKDFQAAMREKVEVDVKIKTEPFENDLVKFVVDSINTRSGAKQENWIKVY